MRPTVSIIVPVYNVEDYLKRCLDSLVNQTMKDIEIIVVNDGSTDNSENIIKEYEKNYPNIIKYYKTENKGLSHARNYGLKYANGKYVSFIDSDDYAKETMMDAMYIHAEKFKHSIVVCDYIKSSEDKEEVVKLNIDENDLESCLLNSKSYAWNKLYKKELFDKIKYPEGLIFEDIAVTYPLIIKEGSVGYVDEALYYYTVNRKDSIMKNKKRDDLKMLDILSKLNQELKHDNHKDLICDLNVRHIYYRFYDMKNHNTRKYNIKFIKEGFNFLNKNFSDWKNTNYLKDKNKNRTTKLYWYIRALIRR